MQNWKLTPDQAQLDLRNASVEARDAAITRGTVVPDRMSTDHPKLKFNFTMEIKLRGDYDQTEFGSRSMAGLDIPLKAVTRPNPSMNMVDVNFYNYRTKIQTKMDYGTFTVTFYDDSTEIAHSILNACLNESSPISTIDPRDQALLDDPSSIPFGALSSTGPLMSGKNGLIRTIKVHHHFMQAGKAVVTTYTYINPKLSTFDLGDLNMAESDVSNISLTFAYDGYAVESDLEGSVNVGGVEVVR